MTATLSRDAYARLMRLIEAERERPRLCCERPGDRCRACPQRVSSSQPRANPATDQDAPSDFAATLPEPEPRC